MPRQILIAVLPYIGGIVVSILALRLVVALSGARLKLAELRNLHRDQEGGVQSLSFVLTLPVFIMIMMFIVQLSQLTIAKAVVEYAAFAAARSAIVWAPANEITNVEYANQIGTMRSYIAEDLETGHSIYQINAGTAKCEKVHFAAAMACMPICPSRDLANAIAQPSSEALKNAYQDVAPEAWANTRVPARIDNKIAYAMANTSVRIRVRHPNNEPPLDTYDTVPPEPNPPFLWEYANNEIGWQDQIEVTVVHLFALLPGPGRLLAMRATYPKDMVPQDTVSDNIATDGTTYVYPLWATARLQNEGQKSVVPFIHNMNGTMGDSF